MEKVISFLHHLHPLSAGMKTELESVLHFSTVKKNQFLHREGDTPKNAWYLQKGLVRCFCERDYREVTIWFIGEDNPVILFKALSGQKKSLYYVQALEDCELYSIKYHDLQILLTKYSEARRMHTIVAAYYDHLKDLKIRATGMLTPDESYRYFEKHYSHLQSRIKLDHIASYLNMDIRTLTRVRKNRQR